jgi:geranylgeranyl diphosphate synthase type II
MPASAPAADVLTRAAACADAALQRWLPGEHEAPARLHQAMRYAVFAGGKRLRPALVLACAEICGSSGNSARVGDCMAAVEALHTYTLVHDDLPAMDDDDLRRGRPTCHKAFDEATAILAGDALQTLAFECCAAVSAAAVTTLARAAGSRGVIGGQQDDLDAEGEPIDTSVACRARLERIHRGKTAALIRASCELGAIAAGADSATQAALASYGEHLGLAFQIADDVLDATATAAQLGKTPGKDAAQGKLTYVAVYGLETAKREARSQLDGAFAALAPFAGRDGALRALAQFVVERQS